MFYYVTMKRGNRTAWLCGPYDNHADAIEKVTDAKRKASEIDAFHDFDEFGTASTEKQIKTAFGVL